LLIVCYNNDIPSGFLQYVLFLSVTIPLRLRTGHPVQLLTELYCVCCPVFIDIHVSEIYQCTQFQTICLYTSKLSACTLPGYLPVHFQAICLYTSRLSACTVLGYLPVQFQAICAYTSRKLTRCHSKMSFFSIHRIVTDLKSLIFITAGRDLRKKNASINYLKGRILDCVFSPTFDCVFSPTFDCIFSPTFQVVTGIDYLQQVATCGNENQALRAAKMHKIILHEKTTFWKRKFDAVNIPFLPHVCRQYQKN
jgi:hypothetical protein